MTIGMLAFGQIIKKLRRDPLSRFFAAIRYVAPSERGMLFDPVAVCGPEPAVPPDTGSR